jgi:hypothetical protein
MIHHRLLLWSLPLCSPHNTGNQPGRLFPAEKLPISDLDRLEIGLCLGPVATWRELGGLEDSGDSIGERNPPVAGFFDAQVAVALPDLEEALVAPGVKNVGAWVKEAPNGRDKMKSRAG